MNSNSVRHSCHATGMFLKYTIAFFITLLTALPPGAQAEEKPPHYDEVMEIIRPLEYSGLTFILNPDVTFSVDDSNKTWTLHNAREYGAKGNILLGQGRYGLCAELAFYTYQRIKPLFSDRYLIKFARVMESDFFDSPESNHVILFIVDSPANEVYLLDPSFHTYGLYGQKSDPKKYTFYGAKNSFQTFEKKETDMVFSLDGTLPLLLKKNYLILLTVAPLNGRFDKQNLIFSVIAKRRGSPKGRYLFSLKKQNNAVKILKNHRLSKRLLSREEENLIGNKLLSWAGQLAPGKES